MFKNILIIGCGLIGSSLLRGIVKKKLTKHIYIFEKSKKNRLITKRLLKKVKFIKNLDNKISNMDLIILATPMSQYKNILKNLSKYITDKNIITDVGSTKNNVENLIKNNSILDRNFILSHPIAGSEVSGPEYGNSKYSLIYCCYNNLLRKFDAYRLKLKEIKPLRLKKVTKNPYFKGFFLIFINS